MALSDHREPLFVAITRPAMFLGVPLDGFAINAMMTYFGYFWWGNANLLSIRGWESGVIFPVVLHTVMRVAVAYDPNMFRIARIWLETRGLQPRRSSVLWPMRWWYARSPREIASGGL